MNLLQGSRDNEEGVNPGGFVIWQNLKRSLKVGFHFQALHLWKLGGFNQVIQLPETENQCVNRLVDEFQFWEGLL